MVVCLNPRCISFEKSVQPILQLDRNYNLHPTCGNCNANLEVEPQAILKDTTSSIFEEKSNTQSIELDCKGEENSFPIFDLNKSTSKTLTTGMGPRSLSDIEHALRTRLCDIHLALEAMSSLTQEKHSIEAMLNALEKSTQHLT